MAHMGTVSSEPEQPPSWGATDRALASGLRWSAATKWSGQVVTWASTLIVARLLAPTDYGLVAMGGVLFGLIQILNDFGLGSAIVRHRELTQHQIAQLGGLCALIGVAGFAVTAAAAGPLAVFFSQPELFWVVVVVSVNYLITGFRTLPLALMQRELRFRDLSLNDLVQAMILAVATPVFAWLGFRYWSLVLAGLIGALLSTLLALRSAPHPLAWPRFREIGAVVSFGSELLVARLAGYVYDNADALIIGRRMGEGPLGNYRIGTTLANLPTDKITSTATQVANPLFATLQSQTEALRRYFCLMTEAVALLTWPAAVGLALVADLLVAVALGPKWLTAVIPLRILALTAIMRCVTPLISPILVARGRSRFMAVTGLAGSIVIPIAFLIGSRWGINGVAYAWAIYFPILSLPGLVLLTREIGLRWTTYGRALWPGASSCGLMAAAVLGVRELISPDVSRPLALGALVGTGVVTYLGALVLFHRARIRSILAVFPSRGAPA